MIDFTLGDGASRRLGHSVTTRSRLSSDVSSRLWLAAEMLDLTPTAQRTREIARSVDDDQLDLITPADMSVRQIIEHLLGLSLAFRDAAAKVDEPTTSTPPEPGTGELPGEWRGAVAERLDDLAAAWSDAAAWDGMTKAGGVDLPGEICGLVALNEVLLHGWDLAAATGRAYAVPDTEAEAVLPIVNPDSNDPNGASRGGLFGPVVPVAADAPLFDQVLGLAGRDPAWAPPTPS